jgi:hypothetical protein
VKQILKNIFGKKDRQQETLPQIETKNPKKTTSKKSAKELATERGEPYVNVISVELDPENIGSGAFELDWNDKFLANLVRAGYQKQPNEPEHVIVDRWFQDVCRNVVLETYEQEQADPDLRRVSRKNLGDGRTEIS